MAKRKVTKPRRPPGRKPSGRPTIPKKLFAQASPLSVGGVSLFDAGERIGPQTVGNFMSDEGVTRAAVGALEDAGFEILQVSPYTINIAAPIATYEKAFACKIVHEELPVIKPGAVADRATFFSTAESPVFGLISTKGTRFENFLEGVAIEVPRYPMVANAFAPKKAYWHLDVPHDVSLGCNADKAHRSGITGKGIRIAMVDSGHFAHPFFSERGYRVSPVTLGPGTADPAVDDNGHGTAESANIFSVAPDIELLPVKIDFANTIGAFNAAVGLNPHIITCSWGSDQRTDTLSPADAALAAAIADAVARGIIVVFSAGNGHFGFPGQHPDVISAGGVFLDESGALRASDYASGFASPVYPGRNCPDLCGLVGMKPRAAYIMLPLQEGCEIDVGLAGGTHPNADESLSNDGWTAISGTSAAAPQLAGACALIKQACMRLTPAEVRDILMRTARDVTVGNCNTASSGAAAGPGTDLATGAGLVDAQAAVLIAKVRCLAPIRPIEPIRPVQPIRPVEPVIPVEPVRPVRPVRPVEPIQPVRPVRPIVPIEPVGPVVRPVGPGGPADQAESMQEQPAAMGQVGLTHEDIAALEEMVIKSKLDPTQS
jgi:subtilisin family serine protease